MKSSKIKSKISHLFKGKSHKLDKYPTFDATSRNQEPTKENEKLESGHGNKKSHKKAKANLSLIDTKKKNLGEFPVLPSPVSDNNESSKLTAEEFAKAVGIKILHKTDEEEDEECDCEYCRVACYNNNGNLNTITLTDENGVPIQQIPNISLNQYSITHASIASSSNSSLSVNMNMNSIHPFPSLNNINRCTSNSTIHSTHSIGNSKTIGTPGYPCHRSRKNSVSKVIDMSLFIPPTEEELRRVHSSSLSVNSTPETSNIPVQSYIPGGEKNIGGSLDRNRNVGYKKNYYGLTPSPIRTRGRSVSTSIASTSRNNAKIVKANDLKTSPVLMDSSISNPARIQFKQYYRCDSGTELSNGNANINPSSPNKRIFYQNSLISSSPSISSLSSSSISQNLVHVPSTSSASTQSTSQSSSSPRQRSPIPSNLSIQCVKVSPKPSNISTPLSSSARSTCSLVTPVKPHSNFKITRSVTISEGTRCSEIDIHPIQPDEIKVYTKGRFTITCEHSRRPTNNYY